MKRNILFYYIKKKSLNIRKKMNVYMADSYDYMKKGGYILVFEEMFGTIFDLVLMWNIFVMFEYSTSHEF